MPCPENIIPTTEWFSEYQQELQILTHANTQTHKYVAQFYDRKHYTSHCINVKFLLSLKATHNTIDYSISVGKVHTMISFNQSAWMKPYILGNNDLRTNAKHEFEKDLFGLMNNSTFGKTVENVNEIIDLHLTTNAQMAIKQVSMLNFTTAQYINGLRMIEK